MDIKDFFKILKEDKHLEMLFKDRREAYEHLRLIGCYTRLSDYGEGKPIKELTNEINEYIEGLEKDIQKLILRRFFVFINIELEKYFKNESKGK